MRLGWRRLIGFMAGDPPTGDDDLSKALRGHREALLKGEKQAVRRMRRAFQRAQRRILLESSGLMSTIGKAQAAGLELGPSWLPRQERYEILLQTIEKQIGRFARTAEKETRQMQRDWWRSGQANAVDLMEIEIATARADGSIPRGPTKAITRLPKEAVEAVVGYLSDGSPLSEIFGKFGRVAATRAGTELTNGVALGWNPRKIARRLRGSLEGDGRRAETIARTEAIRAHRTAAIGNYSANSDVVAGWRWSSSRDRRTCPICLGLDGQEFGFDQSMGSHPQCRCVPVPINRYRPSTRGTGEEWLRAQPDAVAREKLGPTRYKMWKGGVPLSSLVRQGNHPKWGPYAKLIPLREFGPIAPPVLPAPILPPPPPPPPIPAKKGAASAAVVLQKGIPKKTKAAIEEAMAVIDELHAPPASITVADALKVRGGYLLRSLAKGKVPVVPSDGRTTLGYFSRIRASDGTLYPMGMSVSSAATEPGFVFAHEFGHLIDHLTDSLPESLSERSTRFEEAWRRTKAHDRIHKAHVGRQISTEYFAYLNQPTEVFARAYSQWAAVKAGGKLLKELKVEQGHRLVTQWEDDDFQELFEVVEEILKDAGLL